ncbi:MAG: ATP-binding protein [Treponema sp.]|nr:ATP-binding protein [Treponema sp.]
MAGFLKLKMTIRARIFIVIIITAIVITVSSLAVGSLFLVRSVREAVESDMLIAVDIADQYITKEIDLIKQKAGEAAREINLLYSAGERQGVLEKVFNLHLQQSKFISLAVFNYTELLDHYGQSMILPELLHGNFMRAAMRGDMAISSTMYCPDGSLVMYISAPVNNNQFLAVVIPGLYFNEIISRLTFRETGYLFLYDADGYVISDYQAELVQQRINFIDLAKTDSSYFDLAAIASRGIIGERGAGMFKINGVPRMSAFRPVSSPNEGWVVGIVAPLNESALNNIPGGIMLMGIITLVLCVITAFIATIILKRPYEEADILRKSAEAMSDSKSNFMATVSHEIRTPMNSIIGFSELALDSEAALKTRDYIRNIKTNANWLLQIINDILDISKVESGRMTVENIPFEMHELFSSCRTIIMPKAVEKGITLYFYVEPSLGKKPLGDPARLRQVLVNLLSNAVKFTNTGMVKLHAVLKEMNEKTITMYFEVKDSGIGMTPEQISMIFDPFAQVETGTVRRQGGTGLGLAITKNIIELMGGKLSVDSSPGIGSKFSFELIFDTIDVNDDEFIDEKIIINEIEKPAFNGEILLCEDNLMNQQVICEHLARVGLKTVVADNGKIGLELIKRRADSGEKQFDLVFMDIHMPVMDGLEASAKIMELKTGVPVVAMTANIMFNDREIYKKSGMTDCVGKPFTSQELWRCLMKYLIPMSKTKEHKYMQLEADMEFQKNLQTLFVKLNKDKYDEITAAMEEGDLALAQRMAHTLKGNAGQIGKIILQKAAADIEYQLKSGKNTVTGEQLIILKTELEMVLNEFSQDIKHKGW